MQIGDTVYIYDSNRRVYRDDKGNKLSRCWTRGHFRECKIIGETTRSWIISHYALKVNKKTLEYTGEYALNGKLYTSEEEVDEYCWIEDNRYTVSEKVRRCEDYGKLKHIERILEE